MNNTTKTVIWVAVLAVLIGASALLYNKLVGDAEPEPPAADTSSAADTAKPGEPNETERLAAPDFSVIDRDGTEVAFSSFAGKPIVLNFWASWCGPCKSEMPAFETVYRELGEDVIFLMVNLTDGSYETLQSATEHVDNNGYTFPVYFDTSQEAAYAYGVSSIPATVVIDSDGYIVKGHTGMLSEAKLRSFISEVWTG